MDMDFGVLTDDLETAKQWVERATGLDAKAKFSTDLGGQYYALSAPDGETIDLVQNFDLFENKPMIDGLESWRIVLFLNEASETSKIVKALSSDGSRFEFIQNRSQKKTLGPA